MWTCFRACYAFDPLVYDVNATHPVLNITGPVPGSLVVRVCQNATYSCLFTHEPNAGAGNVELNLRVYLAGVVSQRVYVLNELPSCAAPLDAVAPEGYSEARPIRIDIALSGGNLSGSPSLWASPEGVYGVENE